LRTIDEMLTRRLLTAAHYHEIRAWISAARTPEAMMQMPARLWLRNPISAVIRVTVYGSP
jgi:hypothetical protein